MLVLNLVPEGVSVKAHGSDRQRVLIFDLGLIMLAGLLLFGFR
jgi:hypothetical protein